MRRVSVLSMTVPPALPFVPDAKGPGCGSGLSDPSCLLSMENSLLCNRNSFQIFREEKMENIISPIIFFKIIFPVGFT